MLTLNYGAENIHCALGFEEVFKLECDVTESTIYFAGKKSLYRPLPGCPAS